MDSELVTEPPPWSPWRPQAPPPAASTVVGPRPSIVAAIKVFHTLAWASIEACVLYVLYTGLAGRTDKRVGFAGGVVLGEILIFVGNRFRCPLTALAERYGAKHGSVTDIYLPTWFAHNLPAIHTPLLVLMAYLHARNLRRQRGLSANVGLEPTVRHGTPRFPPTGRSGVPGVTATCRSGLRTVPTLRDEPDAGWQPRHRQREATICAR